MLSNSASLAGMKRKRRRLLQKGIGSPNSFSDMAVQTKIEQGPRQVSSPLEMQTSPALNGRILEQLG